MPPQGLRLDAVRKHGHPAEDGFRDEHGPLRLSAQAFQSDGRVHDVAEVGDLVPIDPYLGRDDTAAMERGTELRDETKPPDLSVAVIAERSSDREDAVDAPGPLNAAHQRPGDNHLIADVVVDSGDDVRQSRWGTVTTIFPNCSFDSM